MNHGACRYQSHLIDTGAMAEIHDGDTFHTFPFIESHDSQPLRRLVLLTEGMLQRRRRMDWSEAAGTATRQDRQSLPSRCPPQSAVHCRLTSIAAWYTRQELRNDPKAVVLLLFSQFFATEQSTILDFGTSINHASGSGTMPKSGSTDHN